jgi:PhzF family phenazine biosynthesis protein
VSTGTSLEILEYAAFTFRGTGGNPAGVVLGAGGLSGEGMRAIAADLGYSESAFVTGRRGVRDLDLRYYSPLAEVPFCGHATVATAVALAERHGTGSFLFHTPVGAIAVSTAAADGEIQATLTTVPTHSRPPTPEELSRSLTALGWAAADLDSRYPPRVAFAGNDHLVLAVHDRRTLATLDYDFDALGTLMAERGWITLQLVWAESPSLFHARDPFPPGGVVEDPATGAAAGAFGGYLVDLGLAAPGEQITILQGFDHGTPSLLLVEPDAGGRVRVTGAASRLAPRS